MVLMRVARCSPGQESCQTISQSPTPTPRQPGSPTMAPCLQTLATLWTPGKSWKPVFTLKGAKSAVSLALTRFTLLLPADTEEKTTCSACWRVTATLLQEWQWERDFTTTPTSLGRLLAWPHQSTMKFWSMMMVRSAGACLDNLLSSYRNGSTIFCFVFFPLFRKSFSLLEWTKKRRHAKHAFPVTF